MCSNRPAEPRRRRGPRTWSLRARLVAAQAALLVLVCVGVGTGTMLAMDRYLFGQLDAQLRDASGRSVVLFDLGPPPQLADDKVRSGPGPIFLNAPGQSIGTVGAVMAGGRVAEAAVITSSGARQRLAETAYRQLAAAPRDHAATMRLDGLGDYRVLKAPASDGTEVVTGLPAAEVQSTLLSVFGIFCAVAAAALGFALVAGTLIVRRELVPLSQVADAAQEVADLDLDRGEVELPTPIVQMDPDRSHTEVGQLGAALNRMIARIADALSARHASETRVRQFVADASHELRTPLAVIRGYTELAQRDLAEVPAEVAHAMGRVGAEAVRMTGLVEDLLLLARLDSGPLLEKKPVDLSQLVVDAVSDIHVAAPDHLWSLDIPDEPVVVPGDCARLHQVVANLLSNCRAHTPPGTSVTVALAATTSDAVLTVADDGPGIPAAQQSEIFERFVRGDSSRSRRSGGTGLGLAIAAAVVGAHDGDITVRSSPGDTVFTVTLPARWSDAFIADA
ncbi:integral membrane sensor signal transduction histidine kinase [Segniliparus rotundus DSM 44985]|uniref:histidine kinase n=1 Tax=Segniliparus rotundus (strain ATCC BAA-972 / CDC 1076 / CIP 108378 / DSM 44985 / JCM 13578) TaxID=640132 RepID=D6Z847_SEGRD|nr:HAMP domain-containing sensor histidine kinase [Segniliparus rotundus]ADG98127.1 integral membrane sensor signal transduction histidine kinase [Segniliparus rotundus DSM 44985]